MASCVVGTATGGAATSLERAPAAVVRVHLHSCRPTPRAQCARQTHEDWWAGCANVLHVMRCHAPLLFQLLRLLLLLLLLLRLLLLLLLLW